MEVVAYMRKKLKFLSYNPFLLQLSYFIVISIIGFLGLRSTTQRLPYPTPTDFDYFFTSVSATTVSSMSVVNMEAFSNIQLVIMTVLMFSGGEVFFSLIKLQLRLLGYNLSRRRNVSVEYPSKIASHELETRADNEIDVEDNATVVKSSVEDNNLVLQSIKCLACVVWGYLFVVLVAEFVLVFLYSRLVSSVRGVLNSKGISIKTFSAFLTISTFMNCGFAPTNENMMVFQKNSGLLLILIPQSLIGNTLYPPTLLLVIWGLRKFSKRPELGNIEKYRDTIGYDHLLPTLHSILLSITVFGFILLQFVLFSATEWGSSQVTAGLNTYQKIVAMLFQVVNTRHSGESTFDLSTVSSAMLVLFIVMMYLPPYTTFLPTNMAGKISQPTKRKAEISWMDYLLLSPLSYLVFSIILICIIEREKLRDDPLNFNVFNITLELISAYGNVGYSMGYSCEKRLNATGPCEDAGYSFVGRWSTGGKVVVILVMFFGRLKNFFIPGCKAWKWSY